MTDWYWAVLGIAVAAFVAYWAAARPRRPARSEAGDRRPPKVRTREEREREREEVPELPKLVFEEDQELDPTRIGLLDRGWLSPPTTTIVYDEDAVLEEPTAPRALILVTAAGQSDKGLRRRRNEDSVLVKEDEGLFVVADGMGGYRGGELASSLAVQTIDDAFSTKSFSGPAHDSIPGRASELARAIQMANDAILRRSTTDRLLEGMGTTVCAARFSPNKQRLYVGHVGDSRLYCLRGGALHQMTSDHTMKDFGMSGAGAAHLSRAVGVWPTVPIDIILGKPRVGDVYLLCSDGLTKMVADDEIEGVLRESEPRLAVDRLIAAANAHGGKDNISVVIVRVDSPADPRAAAA